MKKKISAVIGSPKLNKSTSAAIVNKLSEILGQDIFSYRAADIENNLNQDYIPKNLLNTDILLLVFPLYVDCLPAPLLKILPHLEDVAKKAEHPLPKVYAIVNCGFYDARQNATALQIAENFCRRANFQWGYGVGIGCGGMINGNSKNIAPCGSLKNVYETLAQLCEDIKFAQDESKNNIFVSARLPRFLYHLFGNIGFKIALWKNSPNAKINDKPLQF